MVALSAVEEIRKFGGPEEEPVAGDGEISTALEDLLDGVGGDLGGEGVEGGFDVVVGASEIAQDSANLVHVFCYGIAGWGGGREGFGRWRNPNSEKRTVKGVFGDWRYVRRVEASKEMG